MDEVEERKNSVLDDPDLKLLLAVWIIGFVSFGLITLFCRRRKATQLLRQKVEIRMKILRIPLVIIALPLLYIAAYKDAPIPRSQRSSIIRTWMYRYPRGSSMFVIHYILGAHFRDHNRLRQLYITFTLAFFTFDSASLLLLRAQSRCINQGTCDMPRGYSLSLLCGLQLRDAIGIIFHLWAMLLLGCLIIMTRSYSPLLPLSYGRIAHKRKLAMRAELARCNLDDQVKNHKPTLPPIYGKRHSKDSPALATYHYVNRSCKREHRLLSHEKSCGRIQLKNQTGKKRSFFSTNNSTSAQYSNDDVHKKQISNTNATRGMSSSKVLPSS